MFQQSQRIIFTFQGGNPDLAALCAECADQVFDTGVWLGFQQVVILVLGAENLGCVVRGVLVQSIEADERQLDGGPIKVRSVASSRAGFPSASTVWRTLAKTPSDVSSSVPSRSKITPRYVFLFIGC